MDVSRRVMLLLLLVGTVSTQWRHSSSGTLADAAVLSSYPTYCAKDMDVNSVPSLADSVKQSFGDNVSLADVELLQVCVCYLPLLYYFY